MRIFKTILISLMILIGVANFSDLMAQTNITVNASSAVGTIPSEIYGNNMAPWVGTNNGSDSTYNTAMQVSGSRNIRWPGGSWADIVNWNDIQCQASYDITTPEYVSFLQKFGGQMHPIVNFSGNWCGTQFTHAQAVSLATAWVTWNLTNSGSAKAKYWDVGNEDYGSWEQGGQGSAGSTLTGTVYGNYFVDYYKAMKAVDPTILIGAVASPGAGDYNSWTPDVLKACKAGGVTPDYLIIHQYPGLSGTGSSVDASSLANLTLPASSKSSLDSMVSTYLGSSEVGQVKYYNDEYNINNGLSILMNEYVNAMYCSQWMMESAKNGWIGCNLWATKNGGSPDFGFINTTTDAPFPNYYVFPMLSGKFGANMVSCNSSAATVRSYAATDASGNLTLFMVNNNPTTSQNATISISGFNPASSGNAWVMLPSGTSATGAPQEAPGLQINGNVNPIPANLASIAGTAQVTGSTFSVNLQPNEMALIVIPPSGSNPTATHTNTPVPPTATKTSTTTFTPTNTPTHTSTNTFTATFTNTVTNTPTSTPTNTPTHTFTNTVTNTATATSTNTSTRTSTPTSTNTATNSPTSTFTATPTATNTVANTATIVLTATSTPTGTPTNSPTNTLTGTPSFTSTNTSTHTPVPPTFTFTSTPTNTPTSTATSTATPIPPTATRTVTNTVTNSPTNTSTATATLTPTEIHTPVPPTVTNTPVPPTATFTHTAVPTATDTPEPPTATNTPTGTGSFTVYYLTGTTANETSSPHPQIEIVNIGTGPLNLNNVEVRYWFNCDCTNQTVQTTVDWAGLLPSGTSVTGDVLDTVVPTSLGGQTDYISYKFTGNLVLQPGQNIQIQARFNLSDYSNMVQSNDWSYAADTSFTQWTHITGYVNGTLVWGQEPVSASTSLASSSVIAYPNPSTGNGVNFAINLSGNGSTSSISSVKDVSSAEEVDPNAQITLKVFTLAGRMIWSTGLNAATYASLGSHTVFWDEKSLSGANLANGIYFVVLTVKSQGQTSSSSVKVLILR